MTDAQGQAVARFTASNVPGMATITASSGASPEVTADVMIGAPSIVMTANPEVVNPGEQSTITVVARNSTGGVLEGNPTVDLIAQGGAIQPATVTLDDAGRAESVFTAGDEARPAEISAFLAGLATPSMVTVEIRDVAASVTVIATPSRISRSSSEDVMITLVATAFNAAGEPAQSVEIIFNTSQGAPGTLASAGQPLGVDNSGSAMDTLTITPDQLIDFGGTSFQVIAQSGNASGTDTITVVP